MTPCDPSNPTDGTGATPVALVVEQSVVVASDVSDVIRTVHGAARVEVLKDLASARDWIMATPRLDLAVISTTQTLHSEPDLLDRLRGLGTGLIVAGERIRDTVSGYPRVEVLPSPFTERMLEAALRRIRDGISGGGA